MLEVPRMIYCIEKLKGEIYNDQYSYYGNEFEFFTDEIEYAKRLNELQYEDIKIHKYIANKVE